MPDPTTTYSRESPFEYKRRTFSDISTIIKGTLIGTSFSKCSFIGSSAERTILSRCIFSDCVFKKVDLLAITFIDCRFYDCNFIECDLLYSNFNKTYFSTVLFSSCSLTDCSIKSSLRRTALTFERTEFERVSFSEKFSEKDLLIKYNECVFIQSKFTSNDFSKTEITRSVMEDTSFDKCTFNESSVLGTTILNSNFNVATFDRVFLHNSIFEKTDILDSTFTNRANIKNLKLIDSRFIRTTIPHDVSSDIIVVPFNKATGLRNKTQAHTTNAQPVKTETERAVVKPKNEFRYAFRFITGGLKSGAI